MAASIGEMKVGGPWSVEDFDFTDQPPLKLHDGPISFDASDGQGFTKQYGGHTPEQQMQHLEEQEAEAYAAALREAGLPPDTPDYPRMATREDAHEVLQKIHQGEFLLWGGHRGKVVPAVSKGFPGTSHLHVASMPGSDGPVYSDTVLACLEDSISFGIVWEGNWQDLWFYVWKRVQRQAAADRKQFLVLTKDDGSIGFNQTIEVTFLQRRGIVFQHMAAKSMLAQSRPLVQAALYERDSKAAAFMQCRQAAGLLQQTGHRGMPLHHFAKLGKLDLLKSALEASADIEVRTFAGATPLFAAAQLGQAGAARLLLEARAEVDRADKDGATPLNAAAYKGQEGVARLLLEARAEVDRADKDGATQLFAAAQQGQEGAARLLLEARAEVDRADNAGATPLFAAAYKGQEGVARLLLEARAEVDRAQHDGATPLYVAAQQGQEGAARLLLEARAEVDRARNDGATPLFAAAAQQGQEGVARLLRQAGAARLLLEL